MLRERPVGIVLADEGGGEQLVVALEILEGYDVETEHDQPGVECNDAGAEVAVDERVGAQDLGVKPRGGVNGVEAVGVG